MSGFITERLINLTFAIGTGNYGDGTPVVTNYSGLRVSANIVEPGGAGAIPTGQFAIYGMTLSDINKISSLGLYYARARNDVITVTAGDAVNGMSQVFNGLITEAYGEFSESGDSALMVTSMDGLLEALKPVAPTSFNGSAPVASIMALLAAQMNYKFENNGVNVVLSNPYFAGTAKAQVEACATAANINYVMRQGLLAIWPNDGVRGFPVPTISPSTGLIGYPSFASSGIAIKTIFNPAIIVGNNINLQSSLQAACGTWTVVTMSHTLESSMPHGQWESEIFAIRPVDGSK